MTSVRLTPDRKDKIVAALQPWIQSPSDVIGRDDFTGLLARHPEVERRHIKLWLTSTEVLDALLNSDIANRTAGAIEHAQRQLRLWVPNPSLERARKILDKHRVCVISGAPGVGKTMLSDVLLAAYTEREYEPVVISADIDEGERAWRPGRRQVFHYDDFLGRVTYGELRLRKNEESRLAQFVDRVHRSKDKIFILTTREYILSEALQRYERLSEIGFDIYKSIVSMKDYTPLIKAKILYNHLFFSDLPYELKVALVPKRRYRDIIGHRNYNPRVIDHAVNLREVSDPGPENFVVNLIATLDNPARVWDSIFNNLPPMGRRILLAVASLPSEVRLDDLRAMVRGLSVGDFDPGDFSSALSMVEGTFLEVRRPRQGSALLGNHDRIVTIRDASVRDYLWGRLEDVDGEAELILSKSIFFEQCVVLYEGQSHVASASGVLAEISRTDLQARVVVDREAISERALELLDSPSPVLIQVAEGSGNHPVRENRSLERRAGFLVSVLIENDGNRKMAQAAVAGLVATGEQWESGRGSSPEGIELLAKVKLVRTLVPEDAVRFATQAFLKLISGRFEQIEDFTALVELADLYPELFILPSRSLESWQSDFENFLDYEKNFILNDLDDPDQIDGETDSIQNVAEALGVDLDEFIVSAAERAEELRHRLEMYYAPDDDELRNYDSVAPEDTADREIDSLFESLV